MALLGLNGAGKTTTMRMLTGFLTPTSGDIQINEFSLLKHPMQLKKQIGYMPENPALYLDTTVEDFLTYMYRLRLYTKQNEKEAVKASMQKTNIYHRRADLVGNLSAGYKKRAALAQALVHNPRVLIFDEPISDLDPLQIIEIRNLIVELKKEHTILVSSHILSEVSQTADRYLFLHDGFLVAQETPHSIRSYLESAYQYQVQVQINEAQVSDLVASLKSIDKVKYVMYEMKSDNMVQLLVDAEEDIRGAISRKVVEKNLALLQIQQLEMDLERLFMKLTSRKGKSAA